MATETVAPPAAPPPPAAAPISPWGVLARWLLAAAALYLVGWLLWRARAAMLPFIIGLILAYLLTPLVNRLSRSMPRPLAIILVYLNAASLFLLALIFLVPPVVDQVQQLVVGFPSLDRLQELANSLLQRYRASLPEQVRDPIDSAVASGLRGLQANLTLYARQAGEFVASSVLGIINTVTFLIGFLIIPIWLFYVINDQQRGRAFINRILHPRLRPDFWNTWHIVDKVFSDYIRGQLLLGLAVGVMAGGGLFILDLLGFEVRYILLLAIVAGLTELIPIIGPIIGAIPAVLVALVTSDDPVRTTLAVVVLYTLIQQIENNFLVPRIVGDSVGVHPAVLTVLLIAMGDVFGLLGVILSAPLAAIARDLYLYAYSRFGGQPPEAALGATGPIKEPAA